MADNYSQFADEFDFPADAAKDAMKILDYDFDDYENRESLPDWFVALHELSAMDEDEFYSFAEEKELSYMSGVDCSYNETDGSLYVASDGSSASTVAWVLAEVMEHHVVEQPVMLQEVYTCSKLRPDEFGCCIFVIGLDSDGSAVIQTQDSSSIGLKMIADMKEQRESTQQSPK